MNSQHRCITDVTKLRKEQLIAMIGALVSERQELREDNSRLWDRLDKQTQEIDLLKSLVKRNKHEHQSN